MGTKIAKKVPPQSPESDFENLKTQIKKILKAKKISYKQLAERLSMSESGVKKIFMAKDCSYLKLSRIARELGVSILGLLEEGNEETLEELPLQEELLKAFSKNQKLFDFCYKLIVERTTVDEATSELKISRELAFGFLRQLDELKMIKLFPGDKIKVPPLKLVKTFGQGGFLLQTYRKWGRDMVETLAHPSLQESGNFLVRSLKMTESTYQEFLQRLKEIDAEFTKRGIREMTLSTRPLKLMRWMSFTDQNSFIQV